LKQTEFQVADSLVKFSDNM